MAFDVINIGTNANDGTGDSIRFGGTKVNNNFAKAAEIDMGQFTPVLQASTTNPTVTHTDQRGQYRRIANVVHFWIGIRWSTFSGGSGNIQIGGLPFQAASAAGGLLPGQLACALSVIIGGVTLPGGRTQLHARVNSGGTFVSFVASGSGLATASVTLAGLPTNGGFDIAGSYPTNQAF